MVRVTFVPHRLISKSLALEVQTVMKQVHIYMNRERTCKTIIQVRCAHIHGNNVQVDRQAWP